jgi:tetratricopeptide (TPR) repeat protein
MKTKTASVILLITLIVMFAGCDSNAKPYEEAMTMFNEGNFAEAIIAFEALGDYMDATERAEESAEELRKENDYNAAVVLFNEGSFTAAATAFEELGNYRDAPERATEARNENEYERAETMFGAGNFSGAAAAFEALGDFRNARVRYVEASEARNEFEYERAEAMLDASNFWEATIIFEALGDFRDAPERAEEIRDLSILEITSIEVDGQGMSITAVHFTERDGRINMPDDWNNWFENATVSDISGGYWLLLSSTIDGSLQMRENANFLSMMSFTFVVDDVEYPIAVYNGSQFVVRNSNDGYILLPEESITLTSPPPEELSWVKWY